MTHSYFCRSTKNIGFIIKSHVVVVVTLFQQEITFHSLIEWHLYFNTKYFCPVLQMQNNLNHFTLVGWSWRPVCSLSGCLFLCRCVCLCGPQLCFRCAFFVRLHFLPTRVCEIGGWWLNRPDAFAGSVVRHQRAQRKGEGVVGGGGVGAGRSSLLTILQCIAWTEHPSPHLLHTPLSPDPLPRHHSFGPVE